MDVINELDVVNDINIIENDFEKVNEGVPKCLVWGRDPP